MQRILWKIGLDLGILGCVALVGCSASNSRGTPTTPPASTPGQPVAGKPGTATKETAPTAGAKTATVRWFGHSTFLLTSSGGTRILMDPFNDSVGYTVPKLDNVDAMTVGHEHGDHNNVGMAPGSPLVIRGLDGGNVAKIDRQVKDVHIRSVESSHGEGRGNNAVFVFEVDGLKIVHLSDLGYTLTPGQVQQITPVDVLMVPVGGVYTIDAAGATTVVQQLNPKVVLPMHYKTAKSRSNWPGTGVEPFLEGKRVERTGSTTLSLDKASLPAATTVFVLNYE